MSMQVGEPEVGCCLCERSTCWDCRGRVVREGSNDHYCSGCDEAICCKCNTNISTPWGSHDPEDHELDDDMDGEEW